MSETRLITRGTHRYRCATAVLLAIAMVTSACGAASPGEGQTAVGQTTVSKWKDGKQAVYLLAFDDNLESQLQNVIPELNRRQVAGTFYVVPGSPLWVATKDQWVDAAKSPFVSLANHTFTHMGVDNIGDLDAELGKTNEVLYQIYADRTQPFLLGFAQPGGVPWNVSTGQFENALQQHNLVDRPPFRGSPMNNTTEVELVASVDDAIARGDMGHNDMHGVGGDYLTTPLTWFNSLLDKLEAEKDRVWVPDVVSYSEYLSERKTAEVKLIRASANEIRLDLSTKADPSLYHYPLTLITKIPVGWISAIVTQNGIATEVPVKGNEIVYDAIPGVNEVRITPK